MEFMIWATVSSWSCFCQLYRASPSLAAKNKISLIGIDHLVISMCRVFSCVFGRGCLLWPVCSLGKTLLAFALLHFVLQGQTCLLFQVISWLPTFAFQSPMKKNTSFWGVSSRRSCRSYESESVIELFNFSFFSIISQGIDLDYCDIEWFALETKYCILDSFVDHDGYSISSKGFLPTIVDKMVIWVKFSHSSPF